MQPAMRILQSFILAFVFPSILAHANSAHQIVAYSGAINILQQRGAEPQALVGIEYRGAQQDNAIRPTVGAWISAEKAAYIYCGYVFDFEPIPQLFFSPSFMFGAYIAPENSYAMGGPLEFKSTLEVGWQLESGYRFSLAFGHVSNGNLYPINPGEEHLLANFSIPL
jgi:lipid A 3-O-deacylase